MNAFVAAAVAYASVGLLVGLVTQGHGLAIVHVKIHRRHAKLAVAEREGSSCLVNGSHPMLVSWVLALLLLACALGWPFLVAEYLRAGVVVDDEEDDRDP